MTRSASFDSPRKKSLDADTLFCASWNLRTWRRRRGGGGGGGGSKGGEQHHRLVRVKFTAKESPRVTPRGQTWRAGGRTAPFEENRPLPPETRGGVSVVSPTHERFFVFLRVNKIIRY